MKKNGQMRIAVQRLILPDGIGETVEATLEGVRSGKDAHVKLDSEGGAEATPPKLAVKSPLNSVHAKSP